MNQSELFIYIVFCLGAVVGIIFYTWFRGETISIG